MLPVDGRATPFFLSFLTLILGVVMGSTQGNGFRLNTLGAPMPVAHNIGRSSLRRTQWASGCFASPPLIWATSSWLH